MADTFFDGVSFESKGIVVETITDDLPEMREEMVAYQGRHGSRATGLTLGPREIRLECRAILDTWEDFDALMEDIAAWVVTDADRELSLRNHPGQHYLAHYSSMSVGDRIGGTGIGGFELTFRASDPVRFGEERVAVVSGSRQIEIGGTNEADMTIAVRGASKDSSGNVVLSIGDESLSVPLSRASGNSVDIDCVSHRVSVNGSEGGITLDSDWPDLTPGRKAVSVSSGTATITWTQRYL